MEKLIQLYSEIAKSEKYHMQLQTQLIKDFFEWKAIFPIDFDEKRYELEQIFSFVLETVVEVMSRSERDLLQVLYKIDIPEKDFVSILHKKNISHKLAEAILQKEIQKIYYRIKYS